MERSHSPEGPLCVDGGRPRSLRPGSGRSLASMRMLCTRIRCHYARSVPPFAPITVAKATVNARRSDRSVRDALGADVVLEEQAADREQDEHDADQHQPQLEVRQSESGDRRGTGDRNRPVAARTTRRRHTARRTGSATRHRRTRPRRGCSCSPARSRRRRRPRRPNRTGRPRGRCALRPSRQLPLRSEADRTVRSVVNG